MKKKKKNADREHFSSIFDYTQKNEKRELCHGCFAIFTIIEQCTFLVNDTIHRRCIRCILFVYHFLFRTLWTSNHAECYNASLWTIRHFTYTLPNYLRSTPWSLIAVTDEHGNEQMRMISFHVWYWWRLNWLMFTAKRFGCGILRFAHQIYVFVITHFITIVQFECELEVILIIYPSECTSSRFNWRLPAICSILSHCLHRVYASMAAVEISRIYRRH